MAVNISWSPASWMSDIRSIIGNKCICDVFMVGAHNAGTHGIQLLSPFGLDAPEELRKLPHVVKFMLRFLTAGVSSRWGRCQSLTIRQLLDHGVRFLDLRMNWSEEHNHKIYTTHFHISVPLREVLQDVKDFLDSPASKDEIIVLDFLHFYGFSNEGAVPDFIEELKLLDEYFIPTAVPISTPLSTLWQSSPKQRVFLVVKAPVSHPAVRSRANTLTSIWVDEMELDLLLNRLEGLLGDNLSKYAPGRSTPKMYVTQAIGTPKKEDIAVGAYCGICPGADTDLYGAAIKKNPHLLDWFYQLNMKGMVRGQSVDLKQKGNIHGNVLLMDFVQEGTHTVVGRPEPLNAVALCVYLNLSKTARS